MKRSNVLGVCLFLLLGVPVTSCSSSMDVTSDYDRDTNFTKYRTYAVEAFTTPEGLSPANKERIINAVKSEMTSKGFKESSTPDMLLHISAIFREKQSVTATTDYYGYGGAYRPYMWRGGIGMSAFTTYNVQNYMDGSLIVDIADATTKSLLWEGIGNEEIYQEAKDPNTIIPAAVKQIMSSFPPGSMKRE